MPAVPTQRWRFTPFLLLTMLLAFIGVILWTLQQYNFGNLTGALLTNTFNGNTVLHGVLAHGETVNIPQNTHAFIVCPNGEPVGGSWYSPGAFDGDIRVYEYADGFPEKNLTLPVTSRWPGKAFGFAGRTSDLTTFAAGKMYYVTNTTDSIDFRCSDGQGSGSASSAISSSISSTSSSVVTGPLAEATLLPIGDGVNTYIGAEPYKTAWETDQSEPVNLFRTIQSGTTLFDPLRPNGHVEMDGPYAPLGNPYVSFRLSELPDTFSQAGTITVRMIVGNDLASTVPNGSVLVRIYKENELTPLTSQAFAQVPETVSLENGNLIATLIPNSAVNTPEDWKDARVRITFLQSTCAPSCGAFIINELQVDLTYAEGSPLSFTYDNAECVSITTSADEEIVSGTFPHVFAGEVFTITATLRNTGTTPWSTHDLAAVQPYPTSIWGTANVSLPSGTTIAPGQTHTFTFQATAPGATIECYDAGSGVSQICRLAWQMRQNNIPFGETCYKRTINDYQAP